MNRIYTDRRGKEFMPAQGDVIKPRRGAFIICLFNNKILLTKQPYAMDVPELPGGGIDEGETPEVAAKREFYEETGLVFDQPFEPDEMIDQEVYFYAEDQHEFWNYHQRFFLITKNTAPFYFEGEQETPEQGLSFWYDLDRINDIQLHAIHKMMLAKALG